MVLLLAQLWPDKNSEDFSKTVYNIVSGVFILNQQEGTGVYDENKNHHHDLRPWGICFHRGARNCQ